MRNRVAPLLIAVALAAAVASCRPAGPSSSFDTLDAEASSLKAAFNEDVGKVRALMLVAPT